MEPDVAPAGAEWRETAAKLPAAELVVVEGAGHILNIERPAAFDAALLAFLDRV